MEWHTIALATEFWQEEYNYEQPGDHPSTPTSMPPPLAKKPNQLAILSKKLEVRTVNANVKDDFTSFINSDATDIPPDCTPLEWWCQPQQRKQYPKLSRMAISILSIPAELSEPERTFSGARRTYSWDRLRITCKTIEMIEYYRESISLDQYSSQEDEGPSYIHNSV
ncbi:transposase [Metarhizium guizhouense ARSEF 977]|uniref:Transposase n=1 Tax=Metarhizium guizhouense (strain ARSEF 977) TaxID=1276136 RepID=A0A0B4G4W4_METGA|nr:transposase [Metarhizium guizhouense ARSEF 977]